MKKFYNFLFISLFIITNIFAQKTNTLSGKVIDAETNEPLPFANIIASESNKAGTTDENGNFILENLLPNDKIKISYVGYQTLTYHLTPELFNSELLIKLQSVNINLQEVTVYANTIGTTDQVKSSSLIIQSKKIREISVGMPDILRSIQSLPGITVNNELKAEFNVRGGNQDENLVLVNGTQVYEPFHIKEASNASIGIFNIDLMKKVNIITGGFSAKYGDKMSSVLDIEYREGNKTKYSGAASISMAYFDGYAEGPIGENASFIFGARKSYMEYVLSLIDYKNISKAKPSFYDLQGVLSYNLTKRNKLLFGFIHANDDFTYKPIRNYSTKKENEDNIANYVSSMFTLKSKNILSSKTLLNGEINYYDQGDSEYRFFFREYKNYDRVLERLTYDTLKIKTLEFNLNIQHQLSSNYEIQAGASYKNITFDQKYDDIFKSNNRIEKGPYGSDTIDVSSYKYALYLENILSLSKRIAFNIGGRIDYFDLNKDFTFSPRLNFSYKLSESTNLKAAWGHFYQSPEYEQLKYSAASDSNTQSQLSEHYVIGLEHTRNFSNENNKQLKFKIEGFYKNYRDLVSSYYGVFERITYSKENDATGNAYGFDVYTSLNIPGFYAWISYGLLFAKENLTNDKIGEYPRYTDQRHTISIVTNTNLGSNWSLSLKGYYGSGFPYTPKTAVKNNEGIWVWKSGKRHSESLPAYKRVDLRISKLFVFESFKILTFIDVSNLFNFKNVKQYEYSSVPDIYKPEPEEILLWPILPTFGVRFEF